MTIKVRPDRNRWDHSDPDPVKITCSKCGSDDVRRDAWAEWDPEQQKWVLGEIFDEPYCTSCETNYRLVDTPLEAGTWEYAS